MLNRISLGTANFTQPYGILSNGRSLESEVAQAIFHMAKMHGIDTFDTAFAYGNFTTLLEGNDNLHSSKIVTKFSVLDDYENIFQSISRSISPFFKGYHALLVHDPQNIEKVDKKALLNLFDKLRAGNFVSKIGVSIYEESELDAFKSLLQPELIQIPLNPLNQKFLDAKFINYVSQNHIEVHARSLFLQGVLLADVLPQSLFDLSPIWQAFTTACKAYGSRLKTLLSWAYQQQWVDKWVIGISSLEDLTEIIKIAISLEKCPQVNFELFKNITHPLIDPRNWKY